MATVDTPTGIAARVGAASPISSYRAPVADILDAMELAGLDDVLQLPVYSHVDRETIEMAVTEFGRFANDVIGPTDRAGDVEGSHLDPETRRVRTPILFHDVYRRYVEGGWGALPFPSSYGGGEFPLLVGLVLQEMFTSANMSLSLNPVLTQSAIELLLAWGDERQQSLYLPKLMTGEWSGTMNLTEPEAGSDLGEVRTRAVQDGDGTWQVTGTKIFITWGDHDLADNIIHLVLARTPGAPAGTKGLSLFLVPRVLVGSDGALGVANQVTCLRTEDKLGIHGSPTCVMEYDGAAGELVGQENGGIRAMFTMMNAARLSIGLQGVSLAERSFQHAYRFAQDRQQGRGLGVDPPRRSPIIDHPDVRRMLLTMRTSAIAARLLVYTATGYRDRARHSPDADVRESAQAYTDLLTPVAKAWSTDVGFDATSVGVQVLGGAGYIEESGMAQHFRDSRIAPIYEGTNGIQAIDLVMRKLPRDGGRWIHQLCDEVAATASGQPVGSGVLSESYASLADAVVVLRMTTEQLLTWTQGQPEDALAGATSYLELMGLTLGGWLMTRRAERSISAETEDGSVGESEFFATEHTARARGLVRPILAGARRLSSL
ncbi:MAG TPA: acyl-CoA dehydrogenase [Acidimicrobiales bacterium]|nr:acyl-CoA dehydrogenase [Acidimicrobiales bacterium]